MDRYHALLNELPTPQRLALAYASAPCQSVTAALLVLDARLAAAVRQAKEPMLAQIRLAWWREQLASVNKLADSREDCLRALAGWRAEPALLTDLVNRWESLIGTEALVEGTIEGLAEARAKALVAALGGAELAVAPAGNWALWEIGRLLGPAKWGTQALALARGRDWRAVRLPRSVRPVAMLYGLARRRASAAHHDGFAPGDALAMLRIGLFGR